MPEPSDRTPAQVHAAEVRRQISRLPRWGWGDRQSVIATCIELGNIYAGQVAKLAERATRAQGIDAVLRRQLADAQAERDEALRKLTGLGAAEAQLLAENEELNRQLAERTAERDEVRRQRAADQRDLADEIDRIAAERNTARTERDDYRNRLSALDESWAELAAERDRLRELLNEAAIADPVPGPGPTSERVIASGTATLSPAAAASAPAAGLCPVSKRADGQHSWKFDGDDPYIECVYCAEMRDALSGRVVRCGAIPEPLPDAKLAAARATRARGSRAKAGAGQDMPGRSESLTAPSLGTEESGFAE